MRANEAKKAVFLRVGALGDLLVGLAALSETLILCSYADLYVVGNNLWLEILQPGFLPRVKGIFVVADNQATAGFLYEAVNGKWERASQFLSLKEFLKDTDVFVNTRIDSLRFAWPAVFAGVQKRYGSAPWPFTMIYSHLATWLGKDPLIHERDAALRLLEGNPHNRFLPRKKHAVSQYINSSPLIQKWRAQGGLPSTKSFEKNSDWKKYWLINPTASRPVKAWAKEKFRDLTKELIVPLRERQMELKIIGSPKETEWLEFVADNKAGIVQPKSIADLMDVVAGASLLIANTSSMQFIAASTKTPVLTLMGKARPEIWGPLGLQDKYIVGKVSEHNKNLDQDEQEVLAFNSIEVADVRKSALSFL
jgi:ADP-heptose:LPS heptosyltransferase